MLRAGPQHPGSTVSAAVRLDTAFPPLCGFSDSCDYGLSAGDPADIVVFDAGNPAQLSAEIGQPLNGFKSGRRCSASEPVRLYDPESER
jgi:hypothetical protein